MNGQTVIALADAIQQWGGGEGAQPSVGSLWNGAFVVSDTAAQQYAAAQAVAAQVAQQNAITAAQQQAAAQAAAQLAAQQAALQQQAAQAAATKAAADAAAAKTLQDQQAAQAAQAAARQAAALAAQQAQAAADYAAAQKAIQSAQAALQNATTPQQIQTAQTALDTAHQTAMAAAQAHDAAAAGIVELDVGGPGVNPLSPIADAHASGTLGQGNRGLLWVAGAIVAAMILRR